MALEHTFACSMDEQAFISNFHDFVCAPIYHIEPVHQISKCPTETETAVHIANSLFSWSHHAVGRTDISHAYSRCDVEPCYFR